MPDVEETNLRMQDDCGTLERRDRWQASTNEARSLTGTVATHVTFDLWSEGCIEPAPIFTRVRWSRGTQRSAAVGSCDGPSAVRVVISGDVALLSVALGRSKWLDLAIALVAERPAVRLIKRNLSSLLNTIFAHAAAFTDDAAIRRAATARFSVTRWSCANNALASRREPIKPRSAARRQRAR